MTWPQMPPGVDLSAEQAPPALREGSNDSGPPTPCTEHVRVPLPSCPTCRSQPGWLRAAYVARRDWVAQQRLRDPSWQPPDTEWRRL